MNRILVDTGFFIALLDKNDQNHEEAKILQNRISLNDELFILWPVLYESLGTAFIKSLNRNQREGNSKFIRETIQKASKVADETYRIGALSNLLGIENYEVSLVDELIY